jgi:hypothetical protein
MHRWRHHILKQQTKYQLPMATWSSIRRNSPWTHSTNGRASTAAATRSPTHATVSGLEPRSPYVSFMIIHILYTDKYLKDALRPPLDRRPGLPSLSPRQNPTPHRRLWQARRPPARHLPLVSRACSLVSSSTLGRSWPSYCRSTARCQTDTTQRVPHRRHGPISRNSELEAGDHRGGRWRVAAGVCIYHGT